MSPPRRKVVAVAVAVAMANFSLRGSMRNRLWRTQRIFVAEMFRSVTPLRISLCLRSFARRRESAGASAHRAQEDSTQPRATDSEARFPSRDEYAARARRDRDAAAAA